MSWLSRRSAALIPVVVFLQDGPFCFELADLGIDVHVVESGRLRNIARGWRCIRALNSLIRTERPDLILNWAAKTHVYSVLAQLVGRTTIPTVWWQQVVPGRDLLASIVNRLPVTAVGCSSHYAAGLQSMTVRHPRTFVVHPGVDVEAIRAAATGPLSSPLREDPSSLLVGIVGRLQRWKNQIEVIDATAALARRGYNVELAVIGGDAYGLDSQYANEVHREAAAQHFKVHLVGHIANPYPLMAQLDVLVNASRPEPFGIVLIEAMALGIPVVAYALGGPAEILDNESGMLIRPGAPGEMIVALERLAADPALRADIGAAGKRKVIADFSTARMVGDLDRNLAALADRSGTGG